MLTARVTHNCHSTLLLYSNHYFTLLIYSNHY
uniref:Uncharacterized protein n=1 Tax=Anguilla anguilla TaxID=7936 RepID=A0A0E9T052_ANGAN